MKTSNKLPIERQEKIAEGLKALRESKNLTQAEVANIVGVTVKTYREWEIGKYAKDNSTHYYPSIDAGNLLSLSELYGVSVDYLLCKSKFISPENDFIGKYTGLSDNAINTLKKVNENKEEYRKYEVLHLIDTLNLIMDEPISFMLFLDHIGDYIDNKYAIPLHYDNKVNDYTESIAEPPRLSLVDVPRKEKEKYIVLGSPDNNPDNPEKYIHRQIPVSFVETYHIDTIRKVLDVWKKEYEKKNSKQKDGD